MLGKLLGRGTARHSTFTSFDVSHLELEIEAVAGEALHQVRLKTTYSTEGRRFVAFLVRRDEPGDPPGAVRIYGTQGHLGFLPAAVAEDWAAVLDRLAAGGAQGLEVRGLLVEHGDELGVEVGLPVDKDAVLRAFAAA